VTFIGLTFYITIQDGVTACVT